MPKVTEVQQDIVIAEPEDFEIPSQDAHRLTLIFIKDLGKKTVEFEGEEKTVYRVRFTFRVDDEKSSKNEELKVFANFNQSLHEKSGLRKFLSQLGITEVKTKFNVAKLVGISFVADIEHNKSKTNGKTYANIGIIQRRSVRFPATFDPSSAAAPAEATEEI